MSANVRQPARRKKTLVLSSPFWKLLLWRRKRRWNRGYQNCPSPQPCRHSTLPTLSQLSTTPPTCPQRSINWLKMRNQQPRKSSKAIQASLGCCFYSTKHQTKAFVIICLGQSRSMYVAWCICTEDKARFWYLVITVLSNHVTSSAWVPHFANFHLLGQTGSFDSEDPDSRGMHRIWYHNYVIPHLYVVTVPYCRCKEWLQNFEIWLMRSFIAVFMNQGPIMSPSLVLYVSAQNHG